MDEDALIEFYKRAFGPLKVVDYKEPEEKMTFSPSERFALHNYKKPEEKMILSDSEKLALHKYVSTLRKSGKPQSTFDTAVLKIMRELSVSPEETIADTGFDYRTDTLREATYTLTNKRVKVVSYEGRLVTFIDTDDNVKRDSPSRFVWLPSETNPS